MHRREIQRALPVTSEATGHFYFHRLIVAAKARRIRKHKKVLPQRLRQAVIKRHRTVVTSTETAICARIDYHGRDVTRKRHSRVDYRKQVAIVAAEEPHANSEELVHFPFQLRADFISQRPPQVLAHA